VVLFPSFAQTQTKQDLPVSSKKSRLGCCIVCFCSFFFFSPPVLARPFAASQTLLRPGGARRERASDEAGGYPGQTRKKLKKKTRDNVHVRLPQSLPHAKEVKSTSREEQPFLRTVTFHIDTGALQYVPPAIAPLCDSDNAKLVPSEMQ
ncbi:unnamed protein product, partial [Ectocarpus sp. 12 AP-2014]